MDNITAAKAIVNEQFPTCDAAFLVGSTVRTEATPTSDLDIVIISRNATSPYEESFTAYGWPVDIIFHTESSLYKFLKFDIIRRRPVLAYMINEGIVLKDSDGFAQTVKESATEAFAAGPAPLSEHEMTHMRCELTKLYDDFVSSPSRAERLILGPGLAYNAMKLMLSFNRQWTGEGKWAYRALYDYSPELADEFLQAIETFYRQDDNALLAAFALRILNAAGGRFSESIVRGKKPLLSQDPAETLDIVD
ncbi:nucleotidyltransferase [Ktedonobacteria bacterium brp13]|nr:nucleotidyltransferase [Ktedonobacteria bacterium brp13]